ncbi:hypothetical protein HDZ31DRAFT_37650 [Schizophyllum fasciatum]
MALRFDCDLAEATYIDLEELVEHVFGDDVLPAPAEKLHDALEEIIQRSNPKEDEEEQAGSAYSRKSRENLVSVLDGLLPPWHELGLIIASDNYMDGITAKLARALNALTEHISEALRTLGVDVDALPTRSWTAVQFATLTPDLTDDKRFPQPDLVLRAGTHDATEIASDAIWPSILSYAYVTMTALDAELVPRPSSAASFLSEPFDDSPPDPRCYSDEEYSDEDEPEIDEEELARLEAELPNLPEQDELPPALETACEAGHQLFVHQPGRRYIFGLTLSANALRLVVLDHSGAVAATPVFPAMHAVSFLRVLTGLLYCTPTYLGVDTTLYTKIDDQTYTTVDGHEYQVLETAFASGHIRGAGTVCRRVQRGGVEYVMKDTWDVEGAGNPEIDILKELDGSIEGIPRLVAHETVNVEGRADSTAFAREEIPSDENHFNTRVHHRYVMHPFADKLENFENKEELLGAFSDAVSAHEGLVDRDILHQDVWITNIMLQPPAQQNFLPNQKPRRRGLLIDLEKACRIGPNGEGVQMGLRTGTVPAMSIRVLADDSASAAHRPADDLESFFYAFLATCATATGPGSPDIPLADTALAAWDDGREYAELARTKAAQVESAPAFESVLDAFTPYCRELKPCARRLREALFGAGAPPATHAALRRVFDEAAGELRRRASPRFTSPRLSGGTARSPFSSPERRGAGGSGALFAAGARSPLASPMKLSFGSPAKSPFSSPTKGSPFAPLTPGGLFGGAVHPSDKRKLDESPEVPGKRPRLAESIPPLVFEDAPPMSSRKRSDSMESGL